MSLFPNVNDRDRGKGKHTHTHSLLSHSRQALPVGGAGGDLLRKNSKHWEHSASPTPIPTLFYPIYPATPPLLPSPSLFISYSFPLLFSFFHVSPLSSPPLWIERASWLYLYPVGLIWRRASAVD